jgi:hypothetical protein
MLSPAYGLLCSIAPIDLTRPIVDALFQIKKYANIMRIACIKISNKNDWLNCLSGFGGRPGGGPVHAMVTPVSPS